MSAAEQKRRANRAKARRQLYKAISHELRCEIWTYLIEHSTGSPSEIARALEVAVSEVSNQMKQLEKYEVVELVDERPTKKGSPEHIYRAIVRSIITEEEVEEMDLPARHGFAGQIIHKTIDDIQAGCAANAFAKRPDWVLTRTLLSLDLEGWERLQDAHKRLLEECFDIQAESDERRSKSGEDPVRVSTSQLCFVIDGGISATD